MMRAGKMSGANLSLAELFANAAAKATIIACEVDKVGEGGAGGYEG
jgi:hypothetical protein